MPDLVPVQTFNRAGWPANSTIELAADAAAALLTAVRDYEAEKHVDLHGDYLAAPVGGYRTLAEVVEMRAAWLAPRTSALWVTVGSGKYNMDPNSRAIPSLTSPHLTGYCMDVSDNGFLAWLIVNGHRYGLLRTLVAENDLRHFQYFPGTSTVALSATALTDTPAPTETKDDNMTDHILLEITNSDKSQQWALVSPDLSKFVPIWKLDTANSLSTRIIQGTALKSAFTDCSKDEWNGFRAAAGLAPDPKVG